MNEKEVASGEELVFADERSKLAWDMAKAVDSIAANLPPEGPNLEARLITFDVEKMQSGRYAIFFAGTVIGTGRKGVFLVPSRSLRILEELKIPYQEVPD